MCRSFKISWSIWQGWIRSRSRRWLPKKTSNSDSTSAERTWPWKCWWRTTCPGWPTEISRPTATSSVLCPTSWCPPQDHLVWNLNLWKSNSKSWFLHARRPWTRSGRLRTDSASATCPPTCPQPTERTATTGEKPRLRMYIEKDQESCYSALLTKASKFNRKKWRSGRMSPWKWPRSPDYLFITLYLFPSQMSSINLSFLSQPHNKRQTSKG